MKQAVLSFFPTCEYNQNGWWGYFPAAIEAALSQQGVEHRAYYWRYARDHTPANVIRRPVSVEQLCSPQWVAQQLLPEIRSYDRVIFHHHGFPVYTALWRGRYALWGRSKWLMTDHFAVTSKSLDRLRWRRVVRALLRRAAVLPEVLVCVSEANRCRMSRLYGSRDVLTILNGVKIPDIPAPDTALAVPHRALFAGRLVREKGVFVLLDAMNLARERKALLKVTVMGMGPEQPALQAAIARMDLHDRVQLIGPQSDPGKHYLVHDFMVIPSIWPEPCPLVSMESQAYYLPAIYTNEGGLPETQVENETGFMVPAHDPEALLQAMLKLQASRERYQQMRLNARQNAESNFSVARMTRDYTGLYMKLLAGMREPQ